MTDSARARLIRTRASEVVVDHILDLLFAGDLREGDRIDLDSLAEVLGVSRVPIREALAQLERDGIVNMPHHRGAFVAAFDAGTIREAFELYALLSGLTSARVAERRDEAVVGALVDLNTAIGAASEVGPFEELAGNFRRVVNLAGGGPHLRALLRTFRGLVPAAARLELGEAMERERGYIAAELEAIRGGSSSDASRIAIEHIRYSGQCAVDGLVRRGVFDAEAEGESPASLDHLVRLIESMRAS